MYLTNLYGTIFTDKNDIHSAGLLQCAPFIARFTTKLKKLKQYTLLSIEIKLPQHS